MKRKQIFGFDYTNNEYMKIFMYLLVGGSAALLEWSLFYIFFRLLSAGAVFSMQTQTVLAATTLAFASSTLYHYVLCNRFVFDSGSRYHRGTEVSLVFVVSAIGLGWNLLLMWLFTSPFGIMCRVRNGFLSKGVSLWHEQHALWKFYKI